MTPTRSHTAAIVRPRGVAAHPAGGLPYRTTSTGPNGETIIVINAPQPAPPAPPARPAAHLAPRWLCAAMAIILVVGALAFLSVCAAQSNVAATAAIWSFILGGLCTGFVLLYVAERITQR